MSGELQDLLIWAIGVGFLISNAMWARGLRRTRRQAERTQLELERTQCELEELKRGQRKALDIRAAVNHRPEPDGRRLKVVEAWFGLAAIASIARWIVKVGPHPATAAIALVTVSSVVTAMVLLPHETDMTPQSAGPPATVKRIPTQRAAPPVTTAPPAAPETSAAPTTTTPSPTATVAPTTSAAPTTTVAKPTTTPATSTPPASTTAPPVATVPLDTTAAAPTSGPTPDSKPGKGNGKGHKGPLAAAASVRRHGLCLQLLIIELGDCHG